MPKKWGEEEEGKYHGKKSKLKEIKEICKDRNMGGWGWGAAGEARGGNCDVDYSTEEKGNGEHIGWQ